MTTGIPRSKVKWNESLVLLLVKLLSPKSEEWFKYLNTAQVYLNTAPHRSISTTPFRSESVHAFAKIQLSANLLRATGSLHSRKNVMNYDLKPRDIQKFRRRIGIVTTEKEKS